MRGRHALGIAAALLLLGVACSTERIDLDLDVAAAPNPVPGVPDGAERTWRFTVAVANPTGVGVFLESMHREILDTDTGYASPLLPEANLEVRGRYIPPGGTLSFEVSQRTLGAPFRNATERRLYHARGDDGRFYSGEVFVRLE